MGTRRKLLLASLVSLTMVLAFVIGLVPSYGPRDLGATPPSDGRMDMVNLLDLILGDTQGGAKQAGITLASGIEGVIVKTPVDNAQTPEIPVPVQAFLPGATNETIRFVANRADDAGAFNGPLKQWTGDVFSDPVDFPFVSAIDVSGFLTGQLNLTGTSLAIYALSNATAVVKATTFVYEDANAAEDALQLTLIETPAATESDTLDADRNGLPDDLFADILPGEIWVTNVLIDGVLRTVMVANLDNTTAPTKQALGDVYVSPSGNVTVQAPNLQAFKDAGLIGAAENGYLVVEVVDDLGALIDQVNGSAVPADIAAWAENVKSLAPGALTTGAQYVEVSLLYTKNSGTQFFEIGDLSETSLDVRLTMQGLTAGENDNVQLWSYPTSVGGSAGDFFVANDPDAAQKWSLIEGASVAGGVLNASLKTLSVFAPYNSGLSLSSASPSSIPQNYPAEVALTGVIPVATAMNVAQAAAAYEVTVGGEAATFRLGPAKQADAAITPFNGTDENTAYITVPALSTLGDVDVTITDLAAPGNTFTLAAGLAVLPTYVVTTQVVGSGTATIALNPANGVGLPANTFMSGSSVQATANYNAAVETFTGWTLNSAPFGATDSVNFTVDQAITLVANFEPVSTGYTLTVETTAGGSVAASPDPDLPGNKYSAGTVVTLTATPLDPVAFTFTGWTGANAGDLSDPGAVTTITMNGDKTVRANFAGVTYQLTVNVSPASSGSVVQNPLPGIGGMYAGGAIVALTAQAAEGYQFKNWTGDVANPNAAVTTVTMNANKTVTANFEPVFTVGPFVPQAGDEDGRAVAWVFGGVVRTLTGTGLTDNTPITILGEAVQGFRAAADGTSVDIVIPALATYDPATTPAQVDVDVVVGAAPNQFTLPILRYRRFYTDANGINNTAFIINSGQVSPVDISLGGAERGELELPKLEEAGRTVYGIARNVQLTDVTAKANTSVLASLLGTGNITTTEAGNLIPNAFDFSFYLYAPEAGKNTPPTGSAAFGAAVRSDGSSLFQIPAAVDAQGNANPLSSPARITLPVNNAFAYADVRNGVAIWGQASAYDYALNQVIAQTEPVDVAYQSELLNGEVDPAMTTASAGNPVNIERSRLYSLNGFSLRKNWLLPSEVADAIRLATATGTADGKVAGGTTLKVVSPFGGLGYVDKVVLKSTSAKAINANATLITAAGTTENEVSFKTPKVSDPGIVDVVIYLKSVPNTPAVTLSRVFEYKKDSVELGNIMLVLLGVLVALIGLAAGGSSGGGGGGPCFIATAAYGTPLAAQIDTLRDVRDSYMLDNAIGTAVVDLYYQVSPPVADVVAKSPMLAAIVRVLLVPVIFLGKVALAMPTLTIFVGLSLGAAFMLRRRARGRA